MQKITWLAKCLLLLLLLYIGKGKLVKIEHTYIVLNRLTPLREKMNRNDADMKRSDFVHTVLRKSTNIFKVTIM
jgi:hypothetical protein